jgi:NTP pyrophosphatase (non-canonical NTP hydrolase)
MMNAQDNIVAAADFVDSCALIAERIYDGNVTRGFWSQPLDDGTRLMLMVTELAEALEAIRHGNPPSDHIPDFSGLEEELADCVIRILDMAQGQGLRVAEAIVAKMEFNETRAYKHGKAL